MAGSGKTDGDERWSADGGAISERCPSRDRSVLRPCPCAAVNAGDGGRIQQPSGIGRGRMWQGSSQLRQSAPLNQLSGSKLRLAELMQ